jgi:hypothetical protein
MVGTNNLPEEAKSDEYKKKDSESSISGGLAVNKDSD